MVLFGGISRFTSREVMFVFSFIILSIHSGSSQKFPKLPMLPGVPPLPIINPGLKPSNAPEGLPLSDKPSSDVGDRLTLLLHGKKADYFVSTFAISAVTAVKECHDFQKSTGKQFRLLKVETKEEWNELLPHLKSLVNVNSTTGGIWVYGKKTFDQTGKISMVWDSDDGFIPMKFIPYLTRNRRQLPAVSSFVDLDQLKSTPAMSSRLGGGDPDSIKNKNNLLYPMLNVKNEETGGCSETIIKECKPIECNVTEPVCKNATQKCEITNQRDCTIIKSNSTCSAKCENCTVGPVECVAIPNNCTVTPKPCKVIQLPICTVTNPECTITPPICGDPIQPPCNLTTTPAPCTTSPPCYNNETCEPNICQIPAIKCPTAVIHCTPEKISCPDPVINCTEAITDCPEPDINCPEPTVKCSSPQVTCSAPVVNCPTNVVTCPLPEVTCTPPEAICSEAKVECSDGEPCNPSTPDTSPCTTTQPTTTPLSTTPQECEGCGCCLINTREDYKWDFANCFEKKLHFICEAIV